MGIPEESLNRKGTTTRKCSRTLRSKQGNRVAADGKRQAGAQGAIARRGAGAGSTTSGSSARNAPYQRRTRRHVRQGGPLHASAAEQAAFQGGLHKAKPEEQQHRRSALLEAWNTV